MSHKPSLSDQHHAVVRATAADHIDPENRTPDQRALITFAQIVESAHGQIQNEVASVNEALRLRDLAERSTEAMQTRLLKAYELISRMISAGHHSRACIPMTCSCSWGKALDQVRLFLRCQR